MLDSHSPGKAASGGQLHGVSLQQLGTTVANGLATWLETGLGIGLEIGLGTGVI